MPVPIKPRFFSTPEEFSRWLAANHARSDELWVGFHKKATGRPSITWPESVGEALSYGWIDGIRKSLDGDSYVIRFTPRRKGSIWSAVNLRKMKELIAAGRVTPAGMNIYKNRDPKKAELYSFEQREAPKLSPRETATFKANATAWKFFSAQPPGYRRLALWWVVSAKRADTRARRLATLIGESARGERIAPLRARK